MKGFIEEYGKIIVVIILTLLMLWFGQTGLAKPLQNSLLKSTGMITNAHNKFDEVTKEPETVTPGASIDIEGAKYIVLEERENNQALIMTASNIGNRTIQSDYNGSTYLRPDGQNASTYESSDVDNYLENEWYNGLSAKMQSAIQATNIKQASYTKYNDPDTKQETGPDGQVYNTISRHVFLPSISEIGEAVDLKSPDKVKEFLNGTNIWTRDSAQAFASYAVYLNAEYGRLSASVVNGFYGVRPTFVIDLSKVDYTEAGHVDYK